MDVLYLCRDGEANEEFRYSLRSLKNLKHDRVFIVGYTPTWVKDTISIPMKQLRPVGLNRYTNTTLLIDKACRTPELSEDFILMNDDFFIMEQMDTVGLYNRGSLARQWEWYWKQGLSRSSYARGIRATGSFLAGTMQIKNPVSYDVHAPMVINKLKMIVTLDLKKRLASHIPVFGLRSLYGNLFFNPEDGITIVDPKAYVAADGVRFGEKFKTGSPFLSTSDASFFGHEAGRYIRKQFPEPGPYEHDTISPS